MTLLRKSFTLMLGEGAARVFGVIVYVVVARSLGVQGFGVFSFATGIAMITLSVIDMGQNAHAGRIISRKGEEQTHLYLRMTINKLGIGVAAIAVVVLVLWVFGSSTEVIASTALLMGWSTAMGAVEGLRAILRALGNMAGDSIITSTESAGRVIAVLFMAVMGAGTVGFSLAFFVEATVAAVVSFVIVSRRIPLVPTALQWTRSKKFFIDSLGIGLVSIATIGFYRIDQVFVLPLAGETASGLYGAAARIAYTAVVPSGMVILAAFPRLSATYTNYDEFRVEFRSAARLASMVGAGVCVVILALAQPMIHILFGPSYAGAVVLLRILALTVGVHALTYLAFSTANAAHRERRVLPRVIVLLVLISVANLVLVPRYGVLASAWISVVGEVLLAGALLHVSWDLIRPGSRTNVEETGC